MLQATKNNETANSPMKNMAKLGVHLLYIYGSPFSAADISNNKWVAHRVASKMKYQKEPKQKIVTVSIWRKSSWNIYAQEIG